MHPNPMASPPLPPAEKALLRSQLDQTALAKKELEENCRKASASLTKATQEKESCQQELLTTKAVCESTQMNLELRKHECDSLRADTSNYFQHIKGMLSPYSCSEVHGQLSWLTKQMEQLFLRQQERESAYIGKKVCEMNVQQHRINCTREKQELEKRLQDAEKQVQGGQEEKKKLLAEKQQLSKELEEKSRAATQAGFFKDQFNICMGSKVRELMGLGGVPGPPLWPRWEHARARHVHLCTFAHATLLLQTRSCPRASAWPRRDTGHPGQGRAAGSTCRPPSPRGAVPKRGSGASTNATARSPPQTDAFFDITGLRVPGGGVRPGPFASTSSYMDALRNQGIFGNMGES